MWLESHVVVRRDFQVLGFLVLFVCLGKIHSRSTVSKRTRDPWVGTGRSRGHLRKTAFPREQVGQGSGKGQRSNEECSTKDGTFRARVAGSGSFPQRGLCWPRSHSVLCASPRSEGFFCLLLCLWFLLYADFDLTCTLLFYKVASP